VFVITHNLVDGIESVTVYPSVGFIKKSKIGVWYVQASCFNLYRLS